MYPKLQPRPEYDIRTYLLLEDYSYLWNGRLISIPKHFLFDGASIPRFAWAVTYSPFDPHIATAALIHDWIYCTHIWNRYDADALFKHVCLEHGANWIKVQAMHRTLRMVGGLPWKVSKKDLEKLQVLYEKLQFRTDFAKFKFPVNMLALESRLR